MKRFLMWSLAILGILFVIALAAAIAVAMKANRGVRDELALIAAMREPRSWADLQGPPLAPAENAAPLMDEAAAWLTTNLPDGLPEVFKQSGAQRDEAQAEQVQRTLATVEPFLALLEQAVERRGCQLEQPKGIALEQHSRLLSAYRDGATCLAERACARAASGDAAGAEADLRRILRLGAQFSYPALIGGVLRRRMSSQLADAVVQITRDGSLPAEECLQRFDPILADADAPNSLHRALIEERVFGLEAIAEIRAGGESGSVPAPVRWTLDMGLRPYLRQMRGYAELARHPFPEASAKLDELEAEVQSLAFYESYFPQMMLPSLSRQFDYEHSGRSRIKMARLALALRAHRQRHGSWPAALAELEPAFPEGIPVDPLTEAAFGYERTEEGVTLRSQWSGTPPSGSEPLVLELVEPK